MDEIRTRFEKLAVFREEWAGYKDKLADQYEGIEEQSEFRRHALEEITGFCKDLRITTRSKDAIELIRRITDFLDDSYVEI
jgi:hypothetical protein